MNLRKMIGQARKAGACKEELKCLRKIGNLSDAEKNPRAPSWVYWYACNVLRGRFVEYEHVLLRSRHYAFQYVVDVVEEPFPLFEPVFADHPELAFEYAKIILNGKFEAGEKAIASKYGIAYSYATEVIKQRFPLGESSIVKNRDFATSYYFLINYNNPKDAEDLIKSSKEWEDFYNSNLKKPL